jgi:hypothetical protein
MLAVRITLLHFSVSAPISFPKSAAGAVSIVVAPGIVVAHRSPLKPNVSK